MHIKTATAIKHHIIVTTIDGGGGDCNHWEAIAVVLPYFVYMLTQEPIVHTEVSTPCSYEVGFVDNEQAKLTFLTYEIRYVV